MALQHQGRNFGGGNPRQGRPEPIFEGTFSPSWITTGITMDTVNFADGLGKFLQENRLATSQIRNVFGEIKRIQIKGYEIEKASFFLLKPKMAYAAKRQINNNPGINELKKVFDLAHEQVKDEKTYKNFVDFFESILAYHKAYGGN